MDPQEILVTGTMVFKVQLKLGSSLDFPKPALSCPHCYFELIFNSLKLYSVLVSLSEWQTKATGAGKSSNEGAKWIFQCQGVCYISHWTLLSGRIHHEIPPCIPHLLFSCPCLGELSVVSFLSMTYLKDTYTETRDVTDAAGNNVTSTDAFWYIFIFDKFYIFDIFDIFGIFDTFLGNSFSCTYSLVYDSNSAKVYRQQSGVACEPNVNGKQTIEDVVIEVGIGKAWGR